MAGERQVGNASPTLAHAFAAGLAGLAGSLAAAAVAVAASRLRSRLARFVPAAVTGAAVSLVALGWLMPTP
jgi:xanthine/uracil permease